MCYYALIHGKTIQKNDLKRSAVNTIYGLKESGKLFNDRLLSLLDCFGFIQTSTSCLFRHTTRPSAFVLVVDDFGIKYQNRDDFDFLVQFLSTLYHVKAHLIAHSFLGSTLKHDRLLRTLSLSYPGYVDFLLARLRPDGIKGCVTPSIYTPPHFGSATPQTPTVDPEPSASAAQRKELQVAVGYVLRSVRGFTHPPCHLCSGERALHSYAVHCKTPRPSPWLRLRSPS